MPYAVVCRCYLYYGYVAFFPAAFVGSVFRVFFFKKLMSVAVFFAFPEDFRFALDTDAFHDGPVVSVVIVEVH